MPDVQILTCWRGVRHLDQVLLMVKLQGLARPTGEDHQHSAEESVQHQHSVAVLCACVVRPLTITYYARVNLVPMGVKIPSACSAPPANLGTCAKIGIYSILWMLLFLLFFPVKVKKGHLFIHKTDNHLRGPLISSKGLGLGLELAE